MAHIVPLEGYLAYPTNLDPQVFWNCGLTDYKDRLDKESGRVLQNQPYASVDFLTCANGTAGTSFLELSNRSLINAGFKSKHVKDEAGMQEELKIWSTPQSVPRCQYV